MDAVLFEERLKAFEPEPLIDRTADCTLDACKTPEGNRDLVRTDFLNFLADDDAKRLAETVIRRYGVGTCGPRAFYGTTDVHLQLEDKLADFFELDAAIVYSDGFAAISSSVAAYCKKSDCVFIDEHTNIPIRQGLLAARSRVVEYAHNSPQDLQEKIDQILKSETKNGKSRKFLILEGVSWTTGKLCPLDAFLTIAERHKMRVFLEETYSIGVLGDKGRGLTEHLNIDRSRLDMIVGQLHGALGSVGGYCVGSQPIIEHQRLSGSGYIFSASLPTFLAHVACANLDKIDGKLGKLRKLSVNFHQKLLDLGLDVESDPLAPFKVISRENSGKFWKYCRDNGLSFIKRSDGRLVLNLNVDLDEDQVEEIMEILKKAAVL